MTVCQVILFGLKPCDVSSCTNNKITEASLQRHHSLITTTTTSSSSSTTTAAAKFHLENRNDKASLAANDYLNLVIKPLVTTDNDTGHESSPIRLKIRETPRGRHHICISQTLLRTHSTAS